MREHVHGEEVANATRTRGGRPEAATGGPARRLLHLQRSAGNAAVTQAIQGGGLGPGVSVQREEEEGEEEIEE